MADGSVIIDTRLLTNGFQKGALDMKATFAKLAAGAKKLGAAIGLAFGAQKIIKFAKESIDLGSDLQEVQNVVDVTFTTMNKQVNEFAKNAMFTAGLSETMAKRYVGTFGAMSQSFGFTEEEALNMSTAMTQLTGDVASFYNLSQDLAYSKLKGVFTGETEGLKDLGIVMTQAALDQYALANGYGKTTAQMSEQEKVALRYQYVLNGLSTASGDYLRTSKSWANQTKLLSLQMDQLKATIGQGLINALTPTLQVINNVIAKLQDFAQAFKSITAAIFGDASGGGDGGIAGGLEESAENADKLGQNIEDAGKAAKKATAGFDEIQKLSGGASAESSGGGGGTSPVTTPQKYVLGGEVVDELSPKLQEIVERLKTLFSDVKTKAEEMFEPLQEIDFGPMKESLSGLWESIETWLGDSGEDLGWVWENIFVPLSGWTIEEAAPAAIDTLSNAIDFLRTVGNKFKPIWTWLWDNFLEPIASWAGDIAVKGLEALASVFEKLTQVLNGELSFEDFISEMSLAESAAFSMIASIVGGPLLGAVAGLGSALASNWESIEQGAEDAVAALKEDWQEVKDWFKTKVTGPIGTAFSNASTKIKEKFSNAKTSIKTGWESTRTWFKDKVATPIGTAFSNASSKIKEKFSAAKTSIKTGWESTKTWFGDKIAKPIANNFSSAALTIKQKFNSAKSALKNTTWTDVKTWFKDKVAAPIGSAFSNAAQTIRTKFSNARKALENNEGWQNVKTFFKDKVASPIGTAFTNAASTIKSKFNNAKSALKNTTWTDVKTWFKDKVATPIGTAFSNAATTIQSKFSGAKLALKNAWTSISGWFKEKVTDPIKKLFSNIFNVDVSASLADLADTIGDKFKGLINSLIDALNKLLSLVISPMNTIIGKMRALKVLGSQPFKNISNITVPQIPKLARGAVIPPNAPFLAMLGDQRTGTNVEAPLSTIQEALANVMAEYGGGDVTINFTGDLAQLGRVLKPVIDRENKRRGGTLAKGTI